ATDALRRGGQDGDTLGAHQLHQLTAPLREFARTQRRVPFVSVDRVAAGVVGTFTEVLEKNLHADAHVLLELGEREAGLLGLLLVLGTERRAADLGEVLRDLRDGVFAPRAVQGQSAEPETRQEALAPRRETAHLRVERLLVAREQRLERHVRVVQHAPRVELDGVQRLTERRFARLAPFLELLVQPAIGGGDAGDAHHARQTAVHLR